MLGGKCDLNGIGLELVASQWEAHVLCHPERLNGLAVGGVQSNLVWLQRSTGLATRLKAGKVKRDTPEPVSTRSRNGMGDAWGTMKDTTSEATRARLFVGS